MPVATLTTAWEDFEVPAHGRGGQVTVNPIASAWRPASTAG